MLAYVGCIVSFIFSERFGRKRPIFFGTWLIIAGAILQTAAYGVLQFIVGRIVSGVGTGLNTSIIPVWQTETLPAKMREKFGSFQYILVCLGASTAYWVNYGLSYAGGAFEWRFATGAQMIFAAFLLCILKCCP